MLHLTRPPHRLAHTNVTVMGSKYIANRLILLGLLSNGTNTFSGFPLSEDMDVALQGAAALGASVERSGTTLKLTGTGGKLKIPKEPIYVGDSGTFSRLLTPLVALATAPITLTASEQMAVRPMTPLFEALRTWGVKVSVPDETKSFPVTLIGPAKRQAPDQELALAGTVSSQFISALLLTAPYLETLTPPSEASDKTPPTPFRIRLTTPLVSRAYVILTLELMKRFGIESVETQEGGHDVFTVTTSRPYEAQTYDVEGDVVAASYFWALALISGEALSVTNYPKTSLMGEAGFVEVLKTMGATFEWHSDSGQGLKIIPPVHPLRGVEISLKDMPDVMPTLAVLALFASSPTRLTDISHLRYKESNRVDDLAIELRSCGATVVVEPNVITIEPLSATQREANLKKTVVLDSHGDHRLAMALSLCAYGFERITLKNPNSVSKSFPNYFEVLKTLGFRTKE